MTDYSLIDPVLTAWARQNGVHLLTQHQDEEVRGIMIYGSGDQQGGMWIGPIDASGMVGVHAGASGGFRLDRLAPLSGLANALSEVYDALVRHISSVAMNMNWYEVWANEGHSVPYILLLRPASGVFEILDPAQDNKRVFTSRSYKDARYWLSEDEFTLVARKEVDE